MENDQTRLNGVCRRCGCNEALALADARAVGFQDEFLAGIYTCCQVVQWADEQWVAWQDAAREDGGALKKSPGLWKSDQTQRLFLFSSGNPDSHLAPSSEEAPDCLALYISKQRLERRISSPQSGCCAATAVRSHQRGTRNRYFLRAVIRAIGLGNGLKR